MKIMTVMILNVTDFNVLNFQFQFIFCFNTLKTLKCELFFFMWLKVRFCIT